MQTNQGIVGNVNAVTLSVGNKAHAESNITITIKLDRESRTDLDAVIDKLRPFLDRLDLDGGLREGIEEDPASPSAATGERGADQRQTGTFLKILKSKLEKVATIAEQALIAEHIKNLGEILAKSVTDP